MSTWGQRVATSLAIAGARRAAALNRPRLGGWMVGRLDVETTRSLGRLELVVSDLCEPAYRRTWLTAARRLLALSGRARRGEINARMVAERLADLPFLWSAAVNERREILRLCEIVGAPALAARVRSPQAARSVACFLGCMAGNEAAQLFAGFSALRLFGTDDRARMIAKMVLRAERGVIDESDAARFAARLGDPRSALALTRALPLGEGDRLRLAEALARGGHLSAAREIAGDLLVEPRPAPADQSAGRATNRS